MATIARLNRGSFGTIDLTEPLEEGIHLRDGWTPRVAKRRRSQFGGKPFHQVEESIPLRAESIVDGGTVMEMLQEVVEAIEQSYAWKMKAEVDPVLFEYLPSETGLAAVLQVPLWGTPEGAQDLLALEPDFNKKINTWFIDFDLPVVRDGEWLGAEETPAASSAVENPGKMTVTFANDAKLPSPVKLNFEESAPSSGVGYRGFLFVADQSDKLAFFEAEAMFATGSGWTTPIGTNSSGDSYKRLTPSAAGLRQLAYTLPSAFNVNARFFSVFFSMRNHSATVQHTLQVELFTEDSRNNVAFRPITLKANDSNPQVVNLRMGALPAPLEQITLNITPVGTGGAGNELDIDYGVILAVDEFTKAIAIKNAYSANDLIFDSAALERPLPVLTVDDGGGVLVYPSYDGDAYILSVGTSLTAVLCLMESSNWRVLAAGSVPVDYALTATRRLGYLTPR